MPAMEIRAVIFVDCYRPVASTSYSDLLVDRGKAGGMHARTFGDERFPALVLRECLDSLHCPLVTCRFRGLFSARDARRVVEKEGERKEGRYWLHAA